MTDYGLAGKVNTHKEILIVALSAGISILYFLLTFGGKSSNVISYFVHMAVVGFLFLILYWIWLKCKATIRKRHNTVLALTVFIVLCILCVFDRVYWLPHASYFLFPVLLPGFIDHISQRFGKDRDIHFLLTIGMVCLGSLLFAWVVLGAGYDKYPSLRYALCPAIFFLSISDIAICDWWKKQEMSGKRHILLLAVLTLNNAVGIGWSLLHNQRYFQIISGLLNGTFDDWKLYRLSVMEAFFHRDIVHLEAMYPNEKYWIPLESDTLASIYIHYGWIPVCILVTLLLAVVCLLIDMSREVRLNIVRYLAIGYVIRMILCLFATVNLLVYEGMIFPFTRIGSPEVIFLGIIMSEVRRERI